MSPRENSGNFRQIVSGSDNLPLSVTVIINNHNHQGFLRQCIDSLLSQTKRPQEIVIVDDGSTDDSPSIIEEYARNHPFIKPVFTSQAGQSIAVSRGITESTEQIILLLDSDDIYSPVHVQTMWNRWIELDKPDLMYCRFFMFGNQEHIKCKENHFRGVDPRFLIGPIDVEAPYDWGKTLALSVFLPGQFLGNINSTICVAAQHAKRLALQDFAKVPGYFCRGNAEYLLLYASSLAGGRRVYVPDRTVGYRVRDDGLSSGHAIKKDSLSMYNFFVARFAMEDWLLHRVPRSPTRMRRLLELELATVPRPSPGHVALYRKAMKLARRQMSLTERAADFFRRRLRSLRVLLYSKGLDTFGKR